MISVSRLTTFLSAMLWLTTAAIPTQTPAARAADAPAVPSAATAPTRYTRLARVHGSKVVDSSPAFAGGRYNATNIKDTDLHTEYASANKGTDTFVDVEFKEPTLIAAFRHVDRNDIATVASSELVFRDADGQVVATVPVTHVNEPAGVTTLVLPSPVTAKRVRWHVTGLGPRKAGCVGGAEVAFYTAGATDPAPTAITLDATALPAIERTPAGSARPLQLDFDSPYAEPIDATVRVGSEKPAPITLHLGPQRLQLPVPAADFERAVRIVVEVAGQTVLQRELPLKPVRKFVMYLLPHSHVDIGYTALQTDIERKQMANIARGIELARATAGNPEGSRYKWNVEVLWAVDSYLRTATPEKQQEFIDAVKKGWVGLDAMYGNELTGLCRPEELLQLFRYATILSGRCGVPIESAMISDVPGYTWGIVPAMAQAGVKYWSIGPNYFDRMGTTFVAWENKPFYWASPSGREKVLCWVPYQGYAISHILRSNLTPKFLFDLMTHLTKTAYPYEITHLRWSGHGDNAPPDEKIPEFVKAWNEKYEYPKVIIATTTEAFREFEHRYGSKLPTFRGDWTPYWEDGAGSSARETAVNRASAERLTQTEALWAILSRPAFPAARFEAAWRNILLYSEHTWGAHNSITEPEAQFVKDQWKIKQAFALDGQTQSTRLLNEALAAPAQPAGPADAIDVFNTTSWMRTDLVTVPRELSLRGDKVTDADGGAVPSQRLATGELAFLAGDVPAFAAKRYTIAAGEAIKHTGATAKDASLRDDTLSVRLDARTGAIVELKAKGIDANLADTNSVALNDYLFVAGSDTKNPLRCGPVKISVKEPGPLVASLLVESDAPGCNKLSREVRLVEGSGRIELINVVDKKRADVRGGKPGDWSRAGHEAKEGVHFGFAFNVPDGVMRMDIPWAVVRPEADQIPGACKNWFTVQRWVDVSNDTYGVTWSTVDAPLVEVGGLTANLLGSQTKPEAWIARLDPTQTLYSWVMNNHWHTNYRAYQEGPTTFRYAIQPHRAFAADAAARFGTALSQPLIAAPPVGDAPAAPRLRIDPPGVIATTLKPSDDGKAWIVRLFGASGKDTKATIEWSDPKPASQWLSDTSEKPIRKLELPIDVPAWDIVTIRANRLPD